MKTLWELTTVSPSLCLCYNSLIVELNLCPFCHINGELIGFSKLAEVYQCQTCLLCYLASSIRDNAVLDNSWYANFDQNPAWGEKFVKTMERAYSKQLERLSHLTTGRVIADVGGGPGVFLAVAQKRGWTVIGVEESPHAGRFAKAAFGIEFIEKLSELPNESVDVVRIAHVLEHVPEPRAFIHELNRVLKKDGILLVIVPNREPLLSKIVNWVRRVNNKTPRLAGAIYPNMHVLGLSTKSLSYLMSHCGLKAQDVFTVSMGSKEYFPLFYDGLLNRQSLRSIKPNQLIRYWLPMWVNNLGNLFHLGEWVVGYFRKTD